MKMKVYYTIRDAAEILGLTVRTVRQYVQDKKIKAKKYNTKGKWYIEKADIEKIMNGMIDVEIK